ncbi:MAG: histidinol-phosphatase HisJ family protein [Spirochaetes bacterium]|nr:histidinol-phosphatase HisJ family protein [Spirochaetota bacterium]
MKKPDIKRKTDDPFIWETHGIHLGTGEDHIKHGIDNLDLVIKKAISLSFPSITFIIHTPRLTRFRYHTERNTDIKFVRGDASYFNYSKIMEEARRKYHKLITVRYGIELEWLGSELGMQWNRAKIFQAPGIDFVIGSVHFSREGIPYDGSREETDSLIKTRGSVYELWAGYIDELIEMIDSCRDLIHAVGHLDIPKTYAPLPKPLMDIEHSSDDLARRMVTLLEMISDYNFAIDLNLSGLDKNCGAFPDINILKKAYKLGIPLAIGTDSHHLDQIGKKHKTGIQIAMEAGYKYYVSFLKGIPEKRPLADNNMHYFQILNLGIEMLNLRFKKRERLQLSKFSFGGPFKVLQQVFPDSVLLGEYKAIRIRKEEKSITISDEPPDNSNKKITCLYARHTDKPGTLSILFNMLASEGINVDTAHLIPLKDGTATAYLELTGPDKAIKEAVEFVMGTAKERFLQLKPKLKTELPPFKKSPFYILQVDGVDLPIPVSKQMVLTVHNDKPGVLLILLSALASRQINVADLQLGHRGDKGFAVLGVEGNERDVAEVLTKLGPQFYEVSHLTLNNI